MTTYHGHPSLKPSDFDWKVSSYIVLLGSAGAAQVLSGVARLRGEEALPRQGRAMALAGTLIGTPILVSHLKTPKRFHHMLRIARPGSPMSWGSWMLTGFGGASFATWAAGALGWTRVADAVQLPAALLGAGVASYPAAMLSATSTPLWAAAPVPLALGFAASSVASGASALALARRREGDGAQARRLEALAMLALGVEAAALAAADARWRETGVKPAIDGGKPALLHRGGAQALGLLAPPLLHAMKRPALASAAIILGGALMRHAVLRGGDRSANRPDESLRFARR